MLQDFEATHLAVDLGDVLIIPGMGPSIRY